MLTKNNFTEEHIRNLQTESRRRLIQPVAHMLLRQIGFCLQMRWNFSPDFSLVSNRDSLVVNAAFLVFSSVRLRDDYYE